MTLLPNRSDCNAQRAADDSGVGSTRGCLPQKDEIPLTSHSIGKPTHANPPVLPASYLRQAHHVPMTRWSCRLQRL